MGQTYNIFISLQFTYCDRALKRYIKDTHIKHSFIRNINVPIHFITPIKYKSNTIITVHTVHTIPAEMYIFINFKDSNQDIQLFLDVQIHGPVDANA